MYLRNFIYLWVDIYSPLLLQEFSRSPSILSPPVMTERATWGHGLCYQRLGVGDLVPLAPLTRRHTYRNIYGWGYPGCEGEEDRSLGSQRLRRRTGRGGLCPPGNLPHLSAFPKTRKKLGWVYPPHWQEQVDLDDAALVPWCQWYDVCKFTHLCQINGAVLVRVYNVHFGHPDRTLDRVCLPNRLQNAREGPTKLQQLQRGLPVGGRVDTGSVWFQLCQQVEDQA